MRCAASGVQEVMTNEVTYRQREMALGSYVAGYRDVRQCERACRACPRYATTWICPPFTYDVEAMLRSYCRIFLLGVQIPLPPGTTVGASLDVARPVVDAINERLLELERATDGFSLTFVGGCRYCGAATCTRPEGLPCRHPEKARPGLEAWGFDVARTAAELLQLEMTWGRDGMAPPALTLVFALLHNSPAAIAW